MTRTGRIASFLFVAVTLFAIVGCDRGPEIHRFSGATMGTTYNVTLVTESAGLPDDLGDGVFAAVDGVDRAMSTYRDDSELMRLNRAPPGEAFSLSEAMAEVLAVSDRIYRDSGGAFDPTVAPLVDLWGFGPPGPRDEPPAPGDIEALLPRVGFDKLSLDVAAGTAIRLEDIQLDLSGVAKGYGADKVADYLKSRGYTDFLVEVGGEMVLSGNNAMGEPWRIAIEAPDPLGRAVQRIVGLSDVAIATSGDYRNYFERDGQRFSHTIDPRSGYPISHRLASVTVLAPTAAEADALATVFMVLGDRHALDYAEQRRIPVFLIVKEEDGFREEVSSAFRPYLDGSNSGESGD